MHNTTTFMQALCQLLFFATLFVGFLIYCLRSHEKKDDREMAKWFARHRAMTADRDAEYLRRQQEREAEQAAKKREGQEEYLRQLENIRNVKRDAPKPAASELKPAPVKPEKPVVLNEKVWGNSEPVVDEPQPMDLPMSVSLEEDVVVSSTSD